MNIFELMIVFLFIASGFFGGQIIASDYGLIGRIVGFFIGSSLFAIIYYLVMHYWNKHFPNHPPCNTEECLSDDYEVEDYNQEKGTIIFRCKCGTKYFQSLPFFKEILPDGSLKPYMKKDSMGRWKRDMIQRELDISNMS